MSGDVQPRSSVGVIGSGIQGVCISLCLIKKGFKVTLFDRDDPGKNSASYGNAGHFSPYSSVPTNHLNHLRAIQYAYLYLPYLRDLQEYFYLYQVKPLV